MTEMTDAASHTLGPAQDCERCGPAFRSWGTVDGRPYCHFSEVDSTEVHHVYPHRFCRQKDES